MTFFEYAISYRHEGTERASIGTIDAYDEQSAREQVRGLVPRGAERVLISLRLSAWNRKKKN